jgi:hypothetical protein
MSGGGEGDSVEWTTHRQITTLEDMGIDHRGLYVARSPRAIPPYRGNSC